MRRIVCGLAALALLGARGTSSRADITYDTVPEWDGVTSVAAWGSVQSGFTPTFGQTFLAPSDPSLLQSFSFFLTSSTPGDTLTYQAAVYEWSGELLGGDPLQGATGSALFLGPDMVFTDTGDFQEVTIDTGGGALTPGGAYVALLTTAGPGSVASNDDAFGLYQWALTGFFTHQPNNGGGGFVFNNNADFSQLSGEPWDVGDDFGDLAWRAEFRIVPEPGGLTLASLGLVGWFLLGRRGRRVRRGETSA